MVLASLGLAPTASAASSSNDISLAFEFEIHKNDTVDVTMITKGEDVGSSSSCDADNIKDSFGDDVKVNAKSGDGGNSCTVTIKGMTIKKFNNNMPSAEITHDNKSKSFTFEMHASGFSSIDQVSVKVTFPGSVSKVSGDGKKSGSTATWNNAQDETGILTAKGADHGSPPFLITGAGRRFPKETSEGEAEGREFVAQRCRSGGGRLASTNHLGDDGFNLEALHTSLAGVKVVPQMIGIRFGQFSVQESVHRLQSLHAFVHSLVFMSRHVRISHALTPPIPRSAA